MSKPPELTLYAYDTRPDIKILKQILEDKNSHIFYTERNLKTIRLKYQAMTEVPSIIEKTMSEVQLWQSNSPFWTNGLSGNEIVDVLSAYCLSEQSREEFDIKNTYNAVKNPFHRRPTNRQIFIDIDKELLNEESKCNKCLTPLIC